MNRTKPGSYCFLPTATGGNCCLKLQPLHLSFLEFLNQPIFLLDFTLFCKPGALFKFIEKCVLPFHSSSCWVLSTFRYDYQYIDKSGHEISKENPISSLQHLLDPEELPMSPTTAAGPRAVPSIHCQRSKVGILFSHVQKMLFIIFKDMFYLGKFKHFRFSANQGSFPGLLKKPFGVHAARCHTALIVNRWFKITQNIWI